MKLRFAALMFVNVWTVVLAGSVWSAAAEPVSLFDGRTLDGWNVLGCEAVVQDGAILIKAGNGLVQTAKKYRDFTLDYEWKALKDDGWDSGVYFRYAEVPTGRPWPPRYQVNCARAWKATWTALRPARIRWPPRPVIGIGSTDGPRGHGVAEGERRAGMAGGRAGKLDSYISLQAEVPGGGQFLFRNIRLTELKGS